MPIAENLRRHRVADLEKKAPLAIMPTATLANAISTMQANRCGCVFVVDGERLVGILTERDILVNAMGKDADLTTTISSLMTSNPTTATDDTSIAMALQKMLDGGYRHMPIVDARGRCTGRISVREIVHYMVEYFPKAVYNLPPEPDQVQVAQEGA